MVAIQCAFYSPGVDPGIIDNTLGCTSHGFSTDNQCITPADKGIAVWEHSLSGTLFSGTYGNVLKELSLLSSPVEAGIVLYRNANGFEDFLCSVLQIHPHASFLGGGASFSGEMTEGRLLQGSAEVSVLILHGKNYRIEKLNIFNDINIPVEVEPLSKRSFNKIRQLPDGNWQNAVNFYREKKTEFMIDGNNFESLCFCDKNRRNLHCSLSNGNINVGANLPEDNLLFMNYVSTGQATERLLRFIDDDDSLIFGCAGIRSLVNIPFYTGKRSLAGFMFGEVVTCGKFPELGNLMLTKLKVL